MTAPNDKPSMGDPAPPATANAANQADGQPVTPPPALSVNAIESKIIAAIDPKVTQSDVPAGASASAVSPQAMKKGHPPRHGLLVFCPHRLVDTVWQIAPDELRQLGIQGVILDLDNTIVKWQQEDMTKEVTTWLQSLQDMGIKLCILSNSLMSTRSERIASRLNSPYVRQARKPSRGGFEKAMEAMGTMPATTAVVGDQMFTDIWGGNRTGIYTIMVKPIHPREFPYTRYVSRPPEKLLLKYFKRNGKI